MDRTTIMRTGIAGAVAGLGLAVGGVALATAESPGTDTSSSSSSRPDGPQGDRGRDIGKLADELGLEESIVAEAMSAVRDDLRPDKPADSTRPTAPTEEQRAEHQAAMATALAKELDISEAKVKAALATIQAEMDANREERRAEGRTDLASRLDSAVEAGTLTDADKASVLKAFDAQVLGGGPGGPGGGPRHGAGR